MTMYAPSNINRRMQNEINKLKALYAFGVERDLSISWFDASCDLQGNVNRWNTPEYKFIEQSLDEVNNLYHEGLIDLNFAKRVNGALLAIFYSPNCRDICRKFAN